MLFASSVTSLLFCSVVFLVSGVALFVVGVLSVFDRLSSGPVVLVLEGC